MKNLKGLIFTTVLGTAAIAQAQPPPVDPPRGGALATEPEELDRAAIAAGIQPVREDIDACNLSGFIGTVKAQVKVAPDGSVSAVSVKDSNDALATCVAGVLQRVKGSLPRTFRTLKPLTHGRTNTNRLALRAILQRAESCPDRISHRFH